MDLTVNDTPSSLTRSPGQSRAELPPDNPLVLGELLQLILQFADQASLAVAARVSRQWSAIVLDELWKSLPSIFPLLKLVTFRKWILSPTKYHKNLLLSLAKADWSRFKEYSRRVRSVGAGPMGGADLPLESAALFQMFGPSPLLPNVKTISWRFTQNVNCTSIIPFIGPKLESLVLEMDESIESLEQSLLLQSLAHRMPALKFLRLASSSFAHNMSTSLAAIISTSPQLTHVELPPFCLTQEVVAAAARLPLLTILSHSKWTKTAETYHQSGMSFEFTPASFPKLEVISFASFPARMSEVLQSTDHVGRLREVFLECPAYNSPQEIKNIFAALGSSAKHLNELELVCCPIPPLADLEPSMDSLSIDTIGPLFSCTQLERFHLFAPHMVPLKVEDVVEMGKCWPEMRSLILCPTPLVNRDRGVDFGILPTFAASFPDLEGLELYFGKEVPEFGGDLHPANQFKDLVVLGVGFSNVPRRKAQDIGFLLASLCSSPPSIEWEPPRYHRGDDIPEEQKAESVAGWEDVKFAMDLAFRIKNFERS